ncbi:hypothetical protein ACHAW6_007756 [Cyclotella cf. meneghiniana]
MTKVPWQTKGNESGKQVFKATRPGQVVSVDQMISTQPGFVAQLKGKLTVQCYKAATIFVDHFSGLCYIHMMTNMSSDETIKAKQAIEQFAANHFVTIGHYHADNGRFADNAFINHCSQRQQQHLLLKMMDSMLKIKAIQLTMLETYEYTQHASIDAIIDDVDIHNSYTKLVPAKVSLQLHAFHDLPKFDGNFNYRTAVGKLNYLGQTTRPDILYTVHKAAKYSTEPRVEHGEAITLPKASSATETLTLQEIGTRNLHQRILVLPNLGVAGLYFMPHAPSSEHPSYSYRLHFLLLRLSI